MDSPEDQQPNQAETSVKDGAGAKLASELQTMVTERTSPGPEVPSLIETANTFESTTDQITESIVQLSETDPEALKLQLPTLRAGRRGGDRYRGNDPTTGKLDGVVVRLIMSGHADLATPLISSSPEEAENLRRTVEYAEQDPVKAGEVADTIDRICDERRTELQQALRSNGASEYLTTTIITTASDPESAGAISPETWAKIAQMPHENQALLVGNNPEADKVAEALTQLADEKLSDEARELLPKVLTLPDAESRQTYLRSFAQARDTVAEYVAENPRGMVRTGVVTQQLAEFADPNRSLLAAQRLFGEDYMSQIGKFNLLMNDRRQTEHLIDWRDDMLTGLIAMRQELLELELPRPDSALETYSDQIRYTDDPETRTSTVIEAVESCRELIQSRPEFFNLLAKVGEPEAAAGRLRGLQPLLLRVSRTNASIYAEEITSQYSSDETADLINQAYEIYGRLGMTDEQIVGTEVVRDARQVIKARKEEGQDSMSLERRLEIACSDRIVKSQYQTAYASRVDQSIASKGAESAPIKLEAVPELARRMHELGLSDEQAAAMFKSWSSYAALSTLMFKARDESIRPERFRDTAVANQTEHIAAQLAAITNFSELYGSAELQQIIDQFGIHSFGRYLPTLLHQQLVDWNEGKVPTTNIVVSARSDWNGSLDKTGFNESLFKEGSTVYFEANDKAELAKIMVRVGQRERDNGRDPQSGNFVKNVMINGHANPQGILLGTEKQHLEVFDYIDATRRRARVDGQINNYRRHLGSGFRVILLACSTAGENFGGANIAESISDEHDTQVLGSAKSTTSVTINADGSVVFGTQYDDPEGSLQPATIYDGRDGNGVKVTPANLKNL